MILSKWAARKMNEKIMDLVKQAEGVVFPYSEKYADAHAAFAKKMWPEKRRRRDAAYNRWKFRGPEIGAVDGLLLAVIEGQVAGQLGLLPATLKVNERQFPAQWACDLIVDPNMRRKKLGSLLLAVGMNRPMITLGSNPSSSSDPAMSRLGFKPLNGPRLMVLPLDPIYDIRLRIPKNYQRLAPVLAILAKPILKLRGRELLKYAGNPKIKIGSWAHVEAAIESQEIKYPHIVHDRAFLDWRCRGFAGFSPELMSISTESGSFAIFQDTPTVFYIFEWKAQTLEDALVLFSAIKNLALLKKSQSISVMANSNQEQTWLKRAGFFTTRTPVKVIYYPSEPLEKHSYFHYCIYDSDGNL